jgi:putative SOS response-associated peptidase YedK
MNSGRREGQAPYYFNHKDGAPLMFTGIWQEAEYKGDKRIAFAIRVALWLDPE